MREILEKVFGIVCNLSLVGSYCILLVLVARLVLRRAPRWCSYLLWGIVFLRLCCPIFPQTQISLIPQRLVMGQTVSAPLKVPGDIMQNERNAGEKAAMEHSTAEAIQISGMTEQTDSDDGGQPETLSQEPSMVTGQTGMSATSDPTTEMFATHSTQMLKTLAGIVLPYLWLIGFVGFAGYHLFSYLRMYYRLRQPENGIHKVEEGICEIKGGHLSFVMGILHPTIYLSSELAGESREVVLCHERVHLQRRDYLIKPAVLFICCVHWFNPLVWLAFYLMNMDCEMSCDEKVVKLLGEESKKVYSYTLLEEASDGRWRKYRGGTICALLSLERIM